MIKDSLNFSVFEVPKISSFRVSNSRDVYDQVYHYSKADREVFLLLFLDSKNKVIDIETHTIGSVDSSAVYPQQVFRSALIHNASALICVHNHPSGDPEPSLMDKEITKQIAMGAYILNIKFLDHVIVGDGRYYSFGDSGLINDYEVYSKEKLKN